jgi:ribose 1,5-bisphosphokinase
LARAAEYQEKIPAGCRRLDNDGNLDDTLAALLALLPSLAKQPQDAVP